MANITKRGRVGVFVCECCGEVFESEWKTRKPRYKNATHRMRAYRARARDRAVAWSIIGDEYDGNISYYPEVLWRVQYARETDAIRRNAQLS